MAKSDKPGSAFAALFRKAHDAGMEAGNACSPTPMVVGSAKSLFSDEIDESKPTYFVPDGPCGFAWINIKPGNSAFANWLKRKGHARKDGYYGGVTYWVMYFNQSMQRKEAFADAFAKVLRGAGIKAYSMSRMD